MLRTIADKTERIVVGLMSGTSVDGIDAALVRIRGNKTELLQFENSPFPESVRSKIFELFTPETATVDKVGYMQVLLGELYARSALRAIRQAGLTPDQVDIIGCHGQTIWHAPEWTSPDGIPVHYTVQIGDGAVIAQRTGIVTVSDFRVADLAAGGNGAPLVPFTEYQMYRSETETILLQNIGGIGNMTVLPKNSPPELVFAFDTGPGNMIMDAVIAHLTDGKERYDADGQMAARGNISPELLTELQKDPYYKKPLPKTTGREQFGIQYTRQILERAERLGLSGEDVMATVTELTAWSIEDAYLRYAAHRYSADRLIVGGGGSYNSTLMHRLHERFAPHSVIVETQEAAGYNSDAKEAVAFAILADKCILEQANTLPSVTGARMPVIMGKISLPAGKGDLSDADI
ncbi:MAG: anhydro-N-acetylmuramic acid kinase [Clostridia bacterium]|nr:anhydro-N-acetylmuramic acid kinase [Clostridia bacterium]